MSIKTVKIYCAKCRTLLYHYQKRGTGHLLKCFQERILKDYTHTLGYCPNCEQQFARETMIRGKPANKIIQGKVYFKK
ncbi:MAG TPA: hypothetical protein DCE42_30340 [Myxococcales bacterium]|nr:hypothetical protein [Deltaproteobacteria bacterium]MBU52386.1 hypothetical protein [Deltaproteobacteria bacterium]HAA59093.1 hypothetical protein [Myxococcales bacterium]